MYDVLRADPMHFGKHRWKRAYPFGDLDFASYVMSIDPELKMNRYGKGKYLLRRAFIGDYLPEDLLMREKAAFSDAVGHSMVDYLKEYANSLYSDEDFARLSEKYDFARPFIQGIAALPRDFREVLSRTGGNGRGFLDAEQIVGGLRRGRSVRTRSFKLRRQRKIIRKRKKEDLTILLLF